MTYHKRLVLIFQIIIIFFIFVSSLLTIKMVMVNSALEKIKKENARLSEENSILSKKLSVKDAVIEDVKKNIPDLTVKEKDILIKKGLKNPKEDIISDLQTHGELMPIKGIFGTHFSFYKEAKVYILNSKWVYTVFDDGSRIGQAILEYEVTPDSEIKWKKVDSFINNLN